MNYLSHHLDLEQQLRRVPTPYETVGCLLADLSKYWVNGHLNSHSRPMHLPGTEPFSPEIAAMIEGRDAHVFTDRIFHHLREFTILMRNVQYLLVDSLENPGQWIRPFSHALVEVAGDLVMRESTLQR